MKLMEHADTIQLSPFVLRAWRQVQFASIRDVNEALRTFCCYEISALITPGV
jgi:hypothetical protein